MRRFLVCIVLLLTGYMAAGQIYTGGKGDGATMSCVPPVVKTLSATEITCVSDTILLVVHATGTNLQYKWQKLGANFFTDLTDASRYLGLGTDSLRILNPTSATDSGRYRCLVVNSCDSDTSEVFHIDLNRAPWLTNPMAAHEYLQYACINTGSVQLVPSFAAEKNDIQYAWKRIDTLSGRTTILPDTTRDLTVKLTPPAEDVEGLYVVSAYNECGIVSDSVFLPVYDIPQVIWDNVVVDGVLTTCEYERLELRAKITGGGSYTCYLEKLYKDWSTGEWRVQNSKLLPSSSIFINGVLMSDAGYYRWAISNQCSDEDSYSEIIELKVEKKPSFIRPASEVYVFPDTTVCEGSTLVMTCTASGSANQYYWTKDGVRIPESEGNVLRLENIQESDAGNYFCVAYNNCIEKETSRPIRVKVTLRPRFDRDPFLKKRACVGDSITYFGVEPDLTTDSLRWYFNRLPLYDNGHYENTTSEDFDILHIGESDLGLYQVKAYNQCGGTLSEPVRLENLAIPVSFKKGVGGYNMLLCAGMEQKLSVATTGTTPIHYRWVLNEHTYESDTNFVEVKGQDVTERNKYKVYAYNVCNAALDSGWVDVEVFEHYKFTGEGEYCAGHTPTGNLTLAGSSDTLTYSLYRDYGIFVKELKGTGDSLKFENMAGGIYYIMATNPKTECSQEMNGRPYIDEWPSPKAPNFFISSYYCMGNSGATLVLGEWENDVQYQLERNQGSGFQNVPYTTFTGGVRIFAVPELNSPPDGEPRIYENMDYGRYRVVATGVNGCTTTITLEDSVYMLPPPSIHKLSALHGDTVNCNIKLADGTIYTEFTELQVDRFMEGATYTLYKNGVPDPDKEPDRTSPIGWSHIGEGEYEVHVETREGCTGTTNKVRIRNVDAPKEQTLSASGSLCAELDTDGDTKTLTIDATEPGVTYEVYRQDPAKLWYKFIGDGNPKDIIIPNQRATFYAKAIDPTGMCSTSFSKDITVKASNFQVSTNPADIYLDAKGLTTWLHVDITGNYVQPLEVQWEKESELQQTGVISLPNTTVHKQYYWPFCPCAAKHDSYGSDWVHMYSHGPNCTLTNCPYLYHAYNPAAHGCVYMGTEWNTYTVAGYARRGKWYDLYYCRDQVTDDAGQEWYENDKSNPFRNRLTTPVNEDRTYKVTVTDGAGCVHSDDVTVRVIGGKLRAEILFSDIHKHYEYPFCPCVAQHTGYHYCSRYCNSENCIRQYHAHKHEGCIKRKTEYIEYRGRYQKYYDLWYCCTNLEATDTIVYKNDELFFCSDAKGGDYVYEKNWSFDAPGYADASWGGMKGDTVMFTAKQSGWLRLRVTSMGQEVRDSIWIEVYRRPFTAYIQDGNGQDRIDSLYLCKGEETKLYAYTAGGDGDVTTTQWWGDGFTGPNTGWWIFTPERSGWFFLTARNDDVVITDSVYILLRESPGTPEVEDPGARCVLPGQSETIKVLSPTTAGVNYVLEYSVDNGGSFVEKDRYNNSRGGAIPFRVESPVRDAGVYRVKAESVAGDHHCSTYSEPIEFIAPPSHDELTSLKYCDGEQLVLQLNSTSTDMSYSILSNRNICFETIHAPNDYFHKQFGAGTYKFVYTRNGHYPFENGLTKSCSDTVDIEIRKVVPPAQVDAVVNNGLGACEGQNATLALSPTERDVTYFLEAPNGERTELFTGNGGVAETVLSARPYGTYQVKAEREGCPTLVNWFTFNRNPKPVVQPDVYYCYPYGKLSLGEGSDLTYTGLEAGVTYILQREGISFDTIVGPGTKTFQGIQNGKYTVLAQNDETNCFSTTDFEVKAEEAPKEFTLYADCAQEKNITLRSSERGVRYTLYRDNEVVATMAGTGDTLKFGVYNTTGVYTVKAENTTTNCKADMNGNVQITELDICDLVQQRPTCTAATVTDLIYPCSSKGWSYYLKDVTTTDTLMSDVLAGTGSAISWSSVGPRMIKPYVSGRVTKNSRYILWGRDVCGDIPLDTIEVGVTKPGSGVLSMENVTSLDNVPAESCINEWENIYLSQVKADNKYVLIGLMDGGYRDSLTSYTATEDNNTDRIFLGAYKAYDAYVLDMDHKGCISSSRINVNYKPMPQLSGLDGTSICGNEGQLEVSLVGKLPNQNYYLYIDSKAEALDTLSASESDIQFRPQTEPGRYWVIVDNIDPVSKARFCRDTMYPSYAIGQAPQAFDITRYPELDGGNIYLCKGDTATISLGRTEKAVEYALFRDGVEVSPMRQYRVDGGEITFSVREAGVYSVVGFLGACTQEMNNKITVYMDTLPKLQLYDTYYYCKGAETGAKIEVLGAPYKCVFELRDGGLGTDPIERDTVQRYWGDGISDTISFNHLCPAGEQYSYVLTFQTKGGCRGHHYFDVEEVEPPTKFEAISTGDAVCEAECTRFGIAGDQYNVEYSLMKVDPDGDYEYNDNYIVGWGDRDTLWFPYPVCERGEFYVNATFYTRPQCSSRLKVNGVDTVFLAEVDTIRECSLRDYEVHYCSETAVGGTITLLNAQAGIEYRLCKDGVDPVVVGDYLKQVCTVEGETLEWTDVAAGEICKGEDFDNGTLYRIWAYNPATRCSKWMEAPVLVIGDKRPEVSAMTAPYYEFCDGEGVLLKTRATGCGLSYEWFRVGTSGNIAVGRDADLEIGQTGSYYCNITNTCGTFRSEPNIVLYVKDETVMTPMGVKTLCEGTPGLIFSEFENVNDGDYIWYRAEKPDAVLSTHPWLEFENVTHTDEGYYVCVGGDMKKGYCNVYADTVFVKVSNHVDSARIQLKRDTLCWGTTKSMSVDLPGYNIQWYFNGEAIPGATARAYSKTFYTTDAGRYAVKISSGCGERDLIPAYDIVVDTVIDHIWHTDDQNLCTDGPLYLEVRTSPMSGVNYVWQQIIAGEPKTVIGNSAGIKVDVPKDVAHVTYRVFYYNTCNDYASSAYQDVEVNVAVSIKATTPWPEEMTFCEGSGGSSADRTLTATMTGTTVHEYVWIFNPAGTAETDTVARGKTVNSYTIPDNKDASGLYTCMMTTDCGRMRYDYSCWVRINTPASIVTDLAATAGKMCEGSLYTPSITATGSDLQFRWILCHKDGTVDTVARGIGYEWEDTHMLSLVTEERYAGDTLKCIVYNNCGLDESTPVILEIEGRHNIDVEPETWVCYDSLATVHVKLMDGHGAPYVSGAWSYELCREDYNPIDRDVEAGRAVDTVTRLQPGNYAVKNLTDGVCDYKDQEMAVFTISERTKATAQMSLPNGKRDTTLCAQADLPIYVKIAGGTGPFEVTIWQKKTGEADWSVFNEWINVNPFYIEAAEAHAGYVYNIPVVNPARFMVTVRDLNGGDGIDGACEVFIDSGTEIIDVNIVPKSNVNWGMPVGRTDYGECELPINLNTILNPSVANGIYHITKLQPGGSEDITFDRNWNSPFILQTDGPGRYQVTYSTGGICDEVTNSKIIFVIDSLPKAHFLPKDTIICTGNMPPRVYVEMRGAEPMDYIRVESSRLRRDGTVEPFTRPGWEAGTPVGTTISYPRQEVPFYIVNTDSIVRYVLKELKDRHGCAMAAGPEISTSLTIAQLPRVTVEGSNQAYDNGFWNSVLQEYSIATGDSVRFRIRMTSGTAPWTLTVTYGNSYPIMDGEVTTYTVYAKDTILIEKRDGHYLFNCEDAHGCSLNNLGTTHRQISIEPDGYFKLEGVLLGGAVDPTLRGQSVNGSQLMLTGVMKSDLMTYGLLPTTDLEPMALAKSADFIDWIYVEARTQDVLGKWTVVARDSCILLKNGKALGRDGSNVLKLPKTGTHGKTFYIAVLHRNHLPVMTANPIQLGASPTAPQTVTFWYKENFWTRDNDLEKHAWKGIVLLNGGIDIWAMAPAYLNINQKALLVSMSNPNASFFNAGAPGYSIFDVNFDGIVDFPGYISDWSQINSYGSSEDAWLLLLNRDKFSEIELEP